MKYIFSLIIIVFSLKVNAQEFLIKDYSFENNGYVSRFISTNLYKEKNGKVERDEVRIKNGKNSVTPVIIIPFDKVNSFRTFLENGRKKFLKWDSLRMENGIMEMEKQIAVYEEKIKFIGDDYGIFIERTDIELNFISWESGRSVMQIKAHANNGVRSDIFAAYLHYGNNELKRSANNDAFQLFLDEFKVENFKKEIEKVNSKASLFE